MAGNLARGIGSSNRGDQFVLPFKGGNAMLSQASFLVGSGGRGLLTGTKLHPLTFRPLSLPSPCILTLP